MRRHVGFHTFFSRRRRPALRWGHLPNRVHLRRGIRREGHLPNPPVHHREPQA